MTEKHAHFRNPPVIETALSVEFAPIEGWGIPHFGLFWSRVRDDLPDFEIQPPLVSEIEQLERPPLSTEIRVQFTNVPEPRCWYKSSNGSQLIQVQGNRFVYNWRKLDTGADYPRYDESVRPSFEDYWQRFSDFVVSEEKLGDCNVVQCEVTYVNHIPKGQGWQEVSDWENVLSCVAGTTGGQFLPSAETAQMALSYVDPERKGRLRVTLSHAVRQMDGAEVIALRLSVRGRPDSSNKDDIVRWLDFGREWVVRGFLDLTTDHMHKLWGREG